MKTIKHYDNFTVEFSYEDTEAHVDVRVFEIIARDDTKLYYEGIGGCGCDDKMTEDIEKANTFFTTYIKWDGCSHYRFGDEEGYLHLCGKFSIENMLFIFKETYEEAGRIMSKKADETQFNLTSTKYSP